MIATKDAVKLLALGPKGENHLLTLIAGVDAAAARVKELSELREKRRAEQPELAVTAGADPLKLAQGQALAGAIGSVLNVIDEDLATARSQEGQALREYKTFVADVQNKRRRLAEFDEDIAKLMGQAGQLRAELEA